MKKRWVVLSVVIILLVAISGGLGYLTAYVQGLRKINDMEVSVHSYVLLLESLTLARKINSSGVAGLIDAVEQNCNDWASFIRVWEPDSPPNTKERIAEALKEWEKAKRKLDELRGLYEEQKEPPEE